jgi:hypothetical protein
MAGMAYVKPTFSPPNFAVTDTTSQPDNGDINLSRAK